MSEREAYIGFSTCRGIGPQRFKLMCEYFGSATAAWRAVPKELNRINLGALLTERFITHRSTFSATEYEKSLLQKEIVIVTPVDETYPQLLKQIPDQSIALYVKGKIPMEQERIIGVVGTRKPTAYGQQITKKFVSELADQGFVIVSGLARGIDGLAHRTALEKGASTVAILGCGVDIIYPPEHRSLYFDIINHNGAVISEVQPGHTVKRGLFPARNRIIAGMSRGVLVTEGAKKSGSTITPRYAAEQGREVFAVPGPITSYLSDGPTELIKQGAKLVTQVEDILEELDIKGQKSHGLPRGENVKAQNKHNELNGEEKIIVDLLRAGEIHYDDLVRQSRISTSKLGVMLTRLELSGIIRPLGNGKYGLNK